MDPASAAGIGLAVVGLAAQCFTGALQALELISSARNLKPEYRYLTLRLRLEQQRCYNWGAECGLLDYIVNGEDPNSLDPTLTGLNRSSILEVLAQMQALAEGFIKLKGKYSSLVPESDTRGSDQKSIENVSDESVPGIKEFLKKAQQHVSSVQLPKRVKWAAVDKDRYEGLLNHLKHLNDALLDLMGERLRKAIYRSTQETRLSVLQLNNKVDELSDFIKALMPIVTANQPQATLRMPGTPSLPNNVVEGLDQYLLDSNDDKQLIGLARFKALNASVESGQRIDERTAKELRIIQPEREVEDARLHRSQVQVLEEPTSSKRDSGRTEGVFHSPEGKTQRIWIEWKNYTPVDEQQTPHPLVLERVQKLAALLRDPNKPASLRVPSCLGYFDDAEQEHARQRSGLQDEDNDRPRELRFGLVYVIPESSPSEKGARMQSLRDLLQSQSVPSLTKRIELARALANCVLSLHSVNWLHKGLNSGNILFATTDAPAVNISNPYVSGFDFARPSQQTEMTEIPFLTPEQALYRHPDAHGIAAQEGVRFRKTFDIYSLGILLVEIACWKTIDTFLGFKNPARATARRIWRDLLEDPARMLSVEASVGDHFRAATRVCLVGPKALDLENSDDESSDMVGVKLSRAFHEKVVRRLEDIAT